MKKLIKGIIKNLNEEKNMSKKFKIEELENYKFTFIPSDGG
jgi:hypothetical protein